MMRKSWIRVACVATMLCMARYIALWFIVGSSHLFFSGATLLAPLAGLYMSPGLLFFWFIPSIMHFSIYHTFTFSLQLLSVYHIPTQLAAWYWRILAAQNISVHTHKARYVFACIPLLCMVLFVAHPVGWYAAPYTLYWIIPSCIALYSPQNRLLHALGSTFTAHAVGSVLWIWTHPGMSAVVWLGLIPVVAYERVGLAISLWVASYVIDVCVTKATALCGVIEVKARSLLGAIHEVVL